MDLLASLDPELRAMAAAFPRLDYADAEAARRTLARLGGAYPAQPVHAGLTVTDHVIDAGGRPLTVRTYQPEKRRLDGALLFIHGGGYILGDLGTDDPRCAFYARETGALIVSVDYRLAPENPYPAGLDDCVAALTWLAGQAPALGADAAKVAVGGVSAGAGLAAAACLVSRDCGRGRVSYQLLINPMIDDRCQTRSMSDFADAPCWNRQASLDSWRHYLGGARSDVPAYAAPARAVSLEGLPPAYIQTADIDPLRDEGLDYAQRLIDAHVPVELHHLPGTFHGSESLALQAAVTMRSRAEQAAVLRHILT